MGTKQCVSDLPQGYTAEQVLERNSNPVSFVMNSQLSTTTLRPYTSLKVCTKHSELCCTGLSFKVGKSLFNFTWVVCWAKSHSDTRQAWEALEIFVHGYFCVPGSCILATSLNLNYCAHRSQKAVTHFSIPGTESPRRNKGIVPICIGMLKYLHLNSHLASAFLLNSVVVWIPHLHLEERIKPEKSGNCSGRNICVQGTWLLPGFVSGVQMKKESFFETSKETCSVEENCPMVFQGKLGGCQLIVPAAFPSAHWQSRFGGRIPMLCLQRLHTALRQQNTMRYLLIFHVHGFSELCWAVPVSSGAHTGKPQNLS